MNTEIPSFFQASVLFGSAVLGGGLNAVAGGGSFFSFPALVFTGIPFISTNATNNAALLVGTVGSTTAYRKEGYQPKAGQWYQDRRGEEKPPCESRLTFRQPESEARNEVTPTCPASF